MILEIIAAVLPGLVTIIVMLIKHHYEQKPTFEKEIDEAIAHGDATKLNLILEQLMRKISRNKSGQTSDKSNK